MVVIVVKQVLRFVVFVFLLKEAFYLYNNLLSKEIFIK